METRFVVVPMLNFVIWIGMCDLKIYLTYRICCFLSIDLFGLGRGIFFRNCYSSFDLYVFTLFANFLAVGDDSCRGGALATASKVNPIPFPLLLLPSEALCYLCKNLSLFVLSNLVRSDASFLLSQMAVLYWNRLCLNALYIFPSPDFSHCLSTRRNLGPLPLLFLLQIGESDYFLWSDFLTLTRISCRHNKAVWQNWPFFSTRRLE